MLLRFVYVLPCLSVQVVSPVVRLRRLDLNSLLAHDTVPSIASFAQST